MSSPSSSSIPPTTTTTTTTSSVVEVKVVSQKINSTDQPIEPIIHVKIFRISLMFPDIETIDIDRSIDTTLTLSSLLKALSESNPRYPALYDLAIQIIEEFSQRSIRTKNLLLEVVALGTIPRPQLLHKVLQTFFNRIQEEAALDVDMLEGLAILLESADPIALRASKNEDDNSDEENQQHGIEPPKKEEKKLDWKEMANNGIKVTLGIVSDQIESPIDLVAGYETATEALSTIGEAAKKSIKTMRDAISFSIAKVKNKIWNKFSKKNKNTEEQNKDEKQQQQQETNKKN